MRHICFVNEPDITLYFVVFSIPIFPYKVRVGHWDASIRSLTAECLYRFSLILPAFRVDKFIVTILPLTVSRDAIVRHGSILALSRIIRALEAIFKTEVVIRSSDDVNAFSKPLFLLSHFCFH